MELTHLVAMCLAALYLASGMLSCTVFRDNQMSISPGTTGPFVWVGNRIFEFLFWFARVFMWIHERHNAKKAMQYFRAEFPNLAAASNEIEDAMSVRQDPLVGMVMFLNAVSRMQDRGMVAALCNHFSRIGDRHRDVRDALHTLHLHIIHAGRDQFGMNRTVKGQTVTAQDVYNRDEYGLHTKPFSYWLQQPIELRDGQLTHPAAPNKSPRQIVTDQARQFIQDHGGPIRRSIQALYQEA